MNCVENYIKSEFVRSEKPAIVFFKGLESLKDAKLTISFDELYKRTIKSQKLLQKLGLKRDITLLLFEAPTPDLYAMILGALGLGIKLMIVEPWMKAEKINEILKKVQPEAMLTGLLGRIVLSRASEVKKINTKFSTKRIHEFEFSESDKMIVEDMKEEDHAILTFTTGTSGSPKGVHRKHQYLVDQQQVLRKHLTYDIHNKMDLTVFTNVVLLNLSLGKGSLVMNPKWTEKSIKDLDNLPKDYEVDTTAMGPAFLIKLMENTKTLDLKSFHLGGALADTCIYEKALKRWPQADFHHVYGSTEAEPVALSDLKVAVEKSKQKGYFQTLFLGNHINEIRTQEIDDTLWVSGPHVSPMYDNDDAANAKNKKRDEDGTVWHNMGDRIAKADDGLWYKGRDFQDIQDFELEQAIYSHLGSSKSFIKRIHDKPVVFGDKVGEKRVYLLEKFPQLANVIERKIIRDVRHRARIDRDKSFTNGVTMKNILEFMKQRVPIIANLILAFGLVYSAAAIANSNLHWSEVAFMVIGLLIFITELRFMDELKDYEKDKVAHPTRPLPSGLVTTKQVNFLINATFALLVAWSAMSWYFFGKVTGACFSITTAWLFLMYKEFFIGEALSKSPIIYAITHQVIIVPVCLYVISVIEPDMVFTAQSFGYCLIVLSSFFTFEVGRKMDPNAHEILGTYLVHYKKVKTNLLITVLLSMSIIGAVLLNKLLWVLVPFLLIVATQVRVYFQEKKFKDLEGLIALNLIYNLWFLILARWLA
jgi:acyl-coenzyme A synthetase/AMP-(fatty) acid ligase